MSEQNKKGGLLTMVFLKAAQYGGTSLIIASTSAFGLAAWAGAEPLNALAVSVVAGLAGLVLGGTAGAAIGARKASSLLAQNMQANQGPS